ncbi:hypothetical protein OG21DRAFT_1479145 [Imleria badia]|nr:hypothetical protein OG21DRAFT_1479145 [Imleria badia]
MSANNYATTGSLNYFLSPANGSRPYHNINADNVTGDHRCNWVEDRHVVDIENFGREASKLTSFVDDKKIEAEYYPQCIDLIKVLTGANSAVTFDHTIRSHRPGEADDGPQKRQPVSLVHIDQITSSSIARIINLWRPISHTALDWPLGLCDFRSVDMKKRLMAVALIYPDGETFGVKFNEAHKWKYMRGMEPDEFVLIKWYVSLRHTLDSVQEGNVAILTPHTGFEDPNTPEGSPLRESIEIRALVFYDY